MSSGAGHPIEPGTDFDSAVRHMFVYGTLRPGDVRWLLLEPFAVDDGVDDATRGRLFDTGLGYPAAIFDIDTDPDTDPDTGGGAALVRGQTVLLRQSTLERALRSLDAEEGTVAGLFRRVSVTTVGGRRAWAYEYGRGLRLTPIASGDWFARDTP